MGCFNMLVLNAEDIRKVFTMEDAINSNEDAFVIQSNGGTEVPVRINFEVKKMASHLSCLLLSRISPLPV